MSENTIEHIGCLIIGGGPAGYTAALYTARAELKPVLFTGSQPGGQLMLTTEVENFPGYPKGIQGPEMMEEFRLQAERFGTDIRYEHVVKVDLESKPKKIYLDDEKYVTADAVIIATGASAKWLGLESEDRLNGRGVSACAVCDGYFYRGTDVAVVGGGDTAAEEALYLSKLCTKVYVLVRRDEMRASKIMQQRLEKAENVEILWNTQTDEILGKDEVEAMRVKDRVTGETREIPINGFFVAIGHKPNTDELKGQLDMDETGYLITQPGSTRTNIEGVFAAGDVQDKIYRQAVTAAGSGCMAALDAERWLAEQED